MQRAQLNSLSFPNASYTAPWSLNPSTRAENTLGNGHLQAPTSTYKHLQTGLKISTWTSLPIQAALQAFTCDWALLRVVQGGNTCYA